MDYLSIGKVSVLLGVCINSLRLWHEGGRFVPDFITPGGHRRYSLAQIQAFRGVVTEKDDADLTVTYARVSSHDQKEHLVTQDRRLELYCQTKGYTQVHKIQDLGSGMNFKKPGLGQLIKLLLTQKVKRLVFVTKDRLLRFGSELIFTICKFFNVQCIALDSCEDLSLQEQLASDVLEVLTVFSSRMYGARSRKNLKAVAKAA